MASTNTAQIKTLIQRNNRIIGWYYVFFTVCIVATLSTLLWSILNAQEYIGLIVIVGMSVHFIGWFIGSVYTELLQDRLYREKQIEFVERKMFRDRVKING